jgi:NADPH2:quinone reductase
MHAIEVRTHGGPEVMELVDAAMPEPGAGEARVRVEAAGVNYVDVYYRTGLYSRPLPMRIGEEGAGIVEAIGEGVTEVAVGDRVAWSGAPGTYATHVAARAASLVRVPDGVGSHVAAALMLQGMTAHYLVRDTFVLGASHTCLVHAASGGVGLLLCQLAKRVGARVIGIVSNDVKAELARGAGCDEVVVSTRSDFEAEVRRITGGVGVDVVYDSVGAATWEQSLRSLRRRGTMVTYGNASGPVPAFSPRVLSDHGSLFLTRPTLRDYVATRAELVLRATELFALVQSRALDVRIHAELPLEHAGDAHRLLESRATSGKILLVP